MPVGLTEETRAMVVQAIGRGESTGQIATSLKISERQVTRMKANLKNFGTIKPVSGLKRGPPKKIDEALEEHVRAYIECQPTAQLKEICGYLNENFGKMVSASTVSRVRKRMEWEKTKYIPEVPSIPLDPSIPQFFENFYKMSDTPDAHDEYVRNFTDEATLIMASTKAVGKEEILAVRQGMWSAVTSRSHNPIKLFPFGPNNAEVMIYGTVEYVFREGGKAKKDWAARAVMAKAEDLGAWKMSLYQVYLDTK